MKEFRLQLIVTALFYLGTTYGQYHSGISVRDTNAVLTTDTNDLSVKFANTITAEDLEKHLTILASDDFEGRETGKNGNNKAADYIVNHFQDIGLTKDFQSKTYKQSVAFTFSKWADTDIYVNEKRFKHLWDYLSFPNKNESRPIFETDEVLYLGYGIDDPKYSDYKKVKEKDLVGKVIMINKGEPMKEDSTYHITKSKTPSDWSRDMDKKLRIAKEKGVALVLIIEDNLKEMLMENRRRLIGAMVESGDTRKMEIKTANHCYISSSIAKEIIGDKEKKVIKARKKINKKGKNKRVKLETKFVINQFKDVNVLNSKNVYGKIIGYDKQDEFIVVSAHYDHLGKKGDQIFNGADDNGSGTSSVLELAEAFSMAAKSGVKFKRSILFLLLTGEEKGLLGSDYYTKHPIVPLEKTIADVNIDMVGRVDDKYQHDPNYIYVIGADRISPTLHNMNEEINKKYSNLTLDYTYNDEKDPNRYYYRSDHYNFAKNGIPSVFFFNGTHDDYHQPSDTVEKINFDKMEKVDRHIFHLVWELAMMEGNLEKEFKN